MTARATTFVAALAVACVVACGGSRAGSGAMDPDDALVQFECPVPDATVWVDGRYIRQVRNLRGGIALSPGRHFVEVRHDDYHTFYVELELSRKDKRRIVVTLAEILR